MLRTVNPCRCLSPARFRRALAVGLLALALVVAQALGVLHRIEHGPAPAGPQTAWELVGDGHADSSDRDSGHDCAAFDHATVADAAPIPGALPLDAATPDAGVASAVVASPLAAQAAGYLARGPPAA